MAGERRSEMEFTVYRQAKKTRPDGTTVYKGEDAPPYVDGRLMLVADGLGGAGAIRHQRFDPALFDEGGVADALFEGIYDDYSDERLARYVADSFAELRAVRDCYSSSVYNMKKSGYFGSRIAAAVFLHEAIYDEALDSPTLFGRVCEQSTPEERDALLAEVGDRLAGRMGRSIRGIARRVNLVNESAYSGLALLGTTLCATLYRDSDDSVEAVYFTAGDSRPYVWTESGGLCQVLEDQEGEDGGMTNYVKANEGERFSIRCDYVRFPKPCVLFNASDGCFDSAAFRMSQMAFERTLLECASASGGEAELGTRLEGFFEANGRHDDSSTMAAVLFGYGSYGEFRESARRRLAVIEREYTSRLPDLLERDYVAEYRAVAEELPRRLSDVKARFATLPAVSDYCRGRILAGEYEPYQEQIASLETRIEDERESISKTTSLVEVLVARNISKFIPSCEPTINFYEDRLVYNAKSIEEQYQQAQSDYRRLLEKRRVDIERHFEELIISIEKMIDAGVPLLSEDYDAIDIEDVIQNKKYAKELLAFVQSIKRKRHPCVQKVLRLKLSYEDINRKIADNSQARVKVICDRLIEGEINSDVIRNAVSPDDCERIGQLIARLRELSEELSRLDVKERSSVFSECQREYWEKNYSSIISLVVSDASSSIPDELRLEAQTIINDLQSRANDLRQNAELQSELLGAYDVSFGCYIGGAEE